MNVDGHSIINERTEKSSRFLVTIGSTIIFIKYFNVPLEDLTVFNVRAPANLFDVVAFAILAFSLTSFLIHWFGDLVSWRGWYKENAVGIFLGKEITLGRALNAKLEKWTAEGDNVESVEGVRKDIATLQTEIAKHNVRVNRIYWYGWLYIAGLHFLVPVIVAVVAFVVLCMNH